MSKSPPTSSVHGSDSSLGACPERVITRAMNLDLPAQEVINGCARRSIAISAIEILLSGGTHLVCVTIEGADDARRLFKQSIIHGKVRRAPFQQIDLGLRRR